MFWLPGFFIALLALSLAVLLLRRENLALRHSVRSWQALADVRSFVPGRHLRRSA